jgi:NAD(P)-dependent dehydrogenase (short-subunit alcohol dehydrogenase family)
MGMKTDHWSTADIPNQSGRVAVVTGSNTGLGLETALALAGSGAEVVIAVRNLDKGEAAKSTIVEAYPDATVQVQSLDLASLDSVRKAAADILERHDHLDLLINNAGVMYTEWQTTSDGFEFQMGVNHLGHFALTMALLERLMATEGSRVVNVSSVGHKFKSKLDPASMMSGEKYDRIAAYSRSKLANLLFTYELQRRLADSGSTTQTLAAHPGLSSTELVRNSPKVLRAMERFSGLIGQSAARGALPQLRAATDPAAGGGEYYGPDGFMEFRGDPVVVTSNDRSHDERLQHALWAESERLTGTTSPITPEV